MLARDSLNLKHSLLKYKKSNPNFPHDGEYLLPLVRSLFRMLAYFLKSETRSACCPATAVVQVGIARVLCFLF